MLNFGFDYTTAATIWATIALVIFIGIAFYFGIHKTIAGALDTRIGKIEAELSEARRLREEAQALVATYDAKRKEAEAEAKAIVKAAKEDAKRIAEEANQSLEGLIARRTKAVEDKIAQAEIQAVAEVRARSADVAVEAARVLLAQKASEGSDAMVDKAIKDVAARLN